MSGAARLDVTAHLEALRRYARVLTRNGSEADDLVQGALLRALEKRASFRDGADLRVWLMSILHNHHIDRLRSTSAATARETAWADLAPGFAPPAGEHAVRLEQLRAAVLTLPEDQREALHLVAIEGLSVAEAADVLSVPPGTVMSRVGRARAALRRWEDGGTARLSSIRLVGGADDAT
ncbi:sigma-70 family RNA polymerase sigma factor [Roseicyclus mahoneyensis]|uniref:RNA polymerase sigma-70 factor (ECF subfamily) n=1 Tax=Roseicyclus mahoneyensis TaxID=164332 RepID=A0A316GFE7_9RHOB|nr:sigma-70 family RNA polymerase sigma factor [Roseicyclus mahoneyensis]PWK59610.1 RNA polymerase sigma-70 factor (ECF subfamily) [Roseicyclus mahoneyensis]